MSEKLSEALGLAGEHAPFPMEARVRKIRPPEWEGRVNGYYVTPHNPLGVSVMSDCPGSRGSVQVYPAHALELCPDQRSPEDQIARVALEPKP